MKFFYQACQEQSQHYVYLQNSQICCIGTCMEIVLRHKLRDYTAGGCDLMVITLKHVLIFTMTVQFWPFSLGFISHRHLERTSSAYRLIECINRVRPSWLTYSGEPRILPVRGFQILKLYAKLYRQSLILKISVTLTVLVQTLYNRKLSQSYYLVLLRLIIHNLMHKFIPRS